MDSTVQPKLFSTTRFGRNTARAILPRDVACDLAPQPAFLLQISATALVGGRRCLTVTLFGFVEVEIAGGHGATLRRHGERVCVALHSRLTKVSYSERSAFTSAITRLLSALASMTPLRARSMMRVAIASRSLILPCAEPCTHLPAPATWQ
jgi:hypothetical protein